MTMLVCWSFLIGGTPMVFVLAGEALDRLTGKRWAA
jgi:hypothetical protein